MLITDYTTMRVYSLEMNGYWTNIYELKLKPQEWPSERSEKVLVYKRAADKGLWYDESHEAICKALNSLEKAVLNAVNLKESEK